MTTLTIRPFADRDLAACGALLADAHRASVRREPAVPERFVEDGRGEAAVRHALLDTDADGAVAERGGRIVGFLGGTRSLTPPESFGAQYAPPRGASMPVAGHAVAEDESAIEVYRLLYAALAERWAADGLFTHHVSMRPADTAVRDAWFLLGFGARTVFAVRDTSPPREATAERAPGIEVHAATAEEIDVVRHLDELESLHHRDSPIFWPHLGRDVAAAVEAFQRAALEGDRNPIFVATRDGEPVAMHFLLVEGGFGNRLSTPDGAVYLYQAIVEPEARGGGVGTALLRHTLDWARTNGHDHITLHYGSANPSGAPFWERQGFVPVEMTLERVLDERIAWAKGR